MTVNLTEILALVAAIVALASFWMSWREIRRANRVIVKLRKFTSCLHQTATSSAHELEVWLFNRGIQMQNIRMNLCFHGPDKSGSMTVPIPLDKHCADPSGLFSRGMTARFLLSSSDKNSHSLLRLLRNFDEQRPAINLYNGSFLARSFPVYRRWDWLRKVWNSFSFRLAFKRRVGEGPEGKGVFKTYQLPYFVIRAEQLRFFLDSCRNDPAHTGN